MTMFLVNPFAQLPKEAPDIAANEYGARYIQRLPGPWQSSGSNLSDADKKWIGRDLFQDKDKNQCRLKESMKSVTKAESFMTVASSFTRPIKTLFARGCKMRVEQRKSDRLCME